MSVTFGTPVENDYTNVTSMAFVMSGVVSGQPIVLVCSDVGTAAPSIGISDNFATPYTWTVIDSNSDVTGLYLRTYIGTGGVGTSGTITLTCASGTYPGGVAVPCIGASLAAGLSAIDVHGINAVLGYSQTPSAAEEGAVCGTVESGGTLTAFPSSPWVNTQVDYSAAAHASVATYASPASGSVLTASWTGTGTHYLSVGLIVKAAGAAPPTDVTVETPVVVAAEFAPTTTVSATVKTPIVVAAEFAPTGPVTVSATVKTPIVVAAEFATVNTSPVTPVLPTDAGFAFLTRTRSASCLIIATPPLAPAP
jgi:hypothetical protein